MATATDLAFCDLVDVAWGLGTVVGQVINLYGPPHRRHVTVELTPELSSYVVDEPTTVSVPLSAVQRHNAVA